MSSFEDIATGAADALRTVTGFETRAGQLEQLCQRRSGGELVVCVVGITSSGKSTFLNAMMGEALLPEQAKATTNLMVRCRHGARRSLEVRFRDGHSEVFDDARLNVSLLHALCSEDGNPDNRKGIEFLELATPYAAVPEGLVLCDTPGLDAYGHEQHGELTLRKYLPLADIALYVTSIRKNIGRADLALVNAILENDQRVLFALTHMDLEVDSYEKGVLYKSREDKLQNHLKGLRQAAVEARLNDSMFGLALVSSKLAKEARGDRSADAWRRSGFAELVAQLERLTTELRCVVEERRLRRLVVVLEGAARDLESVQATSLARPSGPDTAEAELSTLQQALIEVREDVHRAGQAWAHEFDIDTEMKRIWTKLGHASNLNSAVTDLGNEWQDKLPRLGAALDKVRKQAVSKLGLLGVTPSRGDHRSPSKSKESFPALTQFTSTRTRETRVRGWFDSIAFWPKSELTTELVYDRKRLNSAVGRYVETVCLLGLEHLSWWRGWMDDSLIQRAQQRVDELANVVRELEHARRRAAKEREHQAALLVRLRALAVDARTLVATARASEPGFSTPAIPAAAEVSGAVTGAHRALIPVLAIFRELEFRRTAMEFLDRLGVLRSPQASVLLLGNRTSAMGALSALAHDRALVSRVQESHPRSWVVMGREGRGGELPIGAAPFFLPRTLEFLPGLRIVVAPDDEHLQLPQDRWARVLAAFDGIGVCVDAPRIDSGMSTLARSPYFGPLAKHPRVFFISGEGRFFDEKLHLLVTEVARRVPRRSSGWPPWFVFEEYDARYTHFMSIAGDVLKHRGTAEELARRWMDLELSTAKPFDLPRLRLAMDAILGEEAR